MKLYLIFLSASLIFSTASFAHGEDRPGPNGGFIRMPGAFHTEVVLANKNQVKVFLLDINWKNPSIKDSKLSLNLGKKNSAAKCEAKDNLYFLCTFKGDLTQKGSLTVDAEREGQRGQTVKYDLPLHLGLNKSESHSNH